MIALLLMQQFKKRYPQLTRSLYIMVRRLSNMTKTCQRRDGVQAIWIGQAGERRLIPLFLPFLLLNFFLARLCPDLNQDHLYIECVPPCLSLSSFGKVSFAFFMHFDHVV